MPSKNPKYRVMIAAGGTGGHVYPAISIADALGIKMKQIDIAFVGTKNHMEWLAVPKAGYQIYPIWVSGLQRRFTFFNALFPLKLMVSLIQSFRLLRRFKPAVMVSCGGYVAGPVGWMASRFGIPLIIQEQNSYPGLTNRMLGSCAKHIFTAFPDAEHYFPSHKVRMVGNPTRKNLVHRNYSKARGFFDITEDRSVLLVLGGSLGAKSINEALLHSLETLHDHAGIYIIWQCGKRYLDTLIKKIDFEDYPRLRLHAFLEDMPAAYAVADLVVSRAGASSCSELMVTGTPSILIPSPFVAGNHQTMNARSMQEQGAAQMLPDEEVRDTLTELVTRLLANQEQLRKMNKAALAMAKPFAAEHIAEEILHEIERGNE